MKNSILFLTTALGLIFTVSCINNESWRVENYHPKEFADSLMVDIVTFMGKNPPAADHMTRHDPVYRKYYTGLSNDFHYQYYYMSGDGIHYYYILRPARHPLGNQRGVGGSFRLDPENRITEFREVFVTHVLDKNTLKEEGRRLFSLMVEKGSIDEHPDHQKLVEWPDERCRYDMEKKEWRYDVGNE